MLRILAFGAYLTARNQHCDLGLGYMAQISYHGIYKILDGMTVFYVMNNKFYICFMTL